MSDRHVISTEKPILFDQKRGRIDIDELIGTCRKEPRRILADDEIGIVVYVGDLDIYRVSGFADPITGEPSPDHNGHWGQKVLQISTARFPTKIMRRQIGSVVMSTTSDNVFLVHDGRRVRKVRGEDLKKGMVLNTGEKVLW